MVILAIFHATLCSLLNISYLDPTLADSTMTPQQQAQFRILDALKLNPAVTQRDLAAQLGLSLGQTNYLLNALIEKGTIKLGNFQRSGGKLSKIAYLLTPAGMRVRMRMTQGYLARKKIEYEALKREIEALEKESQQVEAAAKANPR